MRDRRNSVNSNAGAGTGGAAASSSGAMALNHQVLVGLIPDDGQDDDRVSVGTGRAPTTGTVASLASGLN